MKKPPVTSGYREINRPLDFVCLGQMRRGLKRSVPPKLDFVSSQTILFVLTSSETIRNSRNTALLSVFAYISWKRRLKPIFMSTCFFPSRDSITPQKWISSAAWPPASRFIKYTVNLIAHCKTVRHVGWKMYSWATHLDDTLRVRISSYTRFTL